MFLNSPPPKNRFLLAAACLLIPFAAARADEPALRELLRDGLYAEEVTRDPEAAAKHYEQVLSRYAEQRGFAAAALFRLAEVRRKQDRKEDAVKLYQQLLAEFPGAATETKLARENLAALGGKPQEAPAAAPADEGAVELARLKVAATASPDVLLEPEALDEAASKGWTQVVKFLLAAGSHRYEGVALQIAAKSGNLDVIKLLLADGGPVPEEVATESIWWAITRKRYTALEFLLKNGVKPGLVESSYGRVPVLARTVLDTGYPAAEILLKNGADIDEMVSRREQAGLRRTALADGRALADGTALALAVIHGKFEPAKWLLEKGAKPDLPDPTYGLTPLHFAAQAPYPEAMEMMEKLLLAGADPNRVSADREAKDDSSGIISNNATPLECAITSKSMALEKTKLLLKYGAKPNRKDSRVSAMLVLAIKAENPNIPELVEALAGAGFSAADPELMKAAIGRNNQKLAGLLLKHGANPNAMVETDPFADPNSISTKKSLLLEAVRAGNVELAKMLIEAGADLKKPGLLTPFLDSRNDSNVEKLRFLLENGVDPNIPDGMVKRDQTTGDVSSFFEVTGKFEEYPYLPINRIRFPGGSNATTDYQKQAATALELVRLMLDAGAKAGPFLGGLLYQVAVIDVKGEVFGKLLAQRPDKVPMGAFPSMEGWQAVPRQMYLDQVLIPALKELPNITLLERETGKRIPLAESREGATLPSTLELLREKKDLMIRGKNQILVWPELTLARRGEEKTLPFDLDGDAALPELRAGDVLEVTWSYPYGNIGNAGYFTSCRYEWAIEKRISFPITLEIDGKPREILLRGDLLSFDPTKAEAPRVDAASLITLFLGNAAVRKDSRVVKREGWNDVRLSTAEGFRFQKGDRLVFETEPRTEPQSGFNLVTLVSPGLPFSQAATVQCGPGIDASLVLPTLVQMITDAYAPKSSWVEIPRENTELFPLAAAQEKSSVNQVPVVLHHPDFSKIRIRRTGGDGKETILEVDLAEAIRRCTDATTPVEARAADVPLKNGDVVELPIVADRKDKVWKGFTPEETRFFHKALAGRVLLNSGSGNIEQLEINYQPPEWRVSPHGILPLPPAEGVASTRLQAVAAWPGALIQRVGAGTINALSDTFVRDGDQIDRRPGDPQYRTPRPRGGLPSVPPPGP